MVPTVFPFDKPPTATKQARKERGERRRNQKSKDRKEQAIMIVTKSESDIDIGGVEEIETEDIQPQSVEVNDTGKPETSTCSTSTECTLLTKNGGYSIARFAHDNKAFQYLTGFDSYEHFQLLMAILGPACYELKYKSKELDAENELFLTLIKLRHGRDDYGIGLDFGVGRQVVSRIVKTWVNFMFYELSELDFWPDKEVIDQHFPTKFKKMFPTTRVILDATEIPIQRPQNCNGQRVTFSTYKNTNTLKTMIGISPRGVVSYVSESYGGSASDRQIIERSSLLKDTMLSSGDSIMADRGIMVQDLFAYRNVQVNTPTTMKGRNQHDAETVIRDRRIASKRIHVERAIGYAKTFKILHKCLKSERIRLGGRIVKVCFLLTNFRDSIVSNRA